MRIYADENIPGSVVTALRAQGHDVCWARTDTPGASDREILSLAGQQKRLIITFDKDFGSLAFQFRLPATCGIILFRIGMDSPSEIAETVEEILSSLNYWIGHFSVVDRDRLRMRPLH